MFEYNDWANNSLIEFMIDKNIQIAKCNRLVNHIIAVQDIWYEAINGNFNHQIDLWEENSLHECLVLSKQSTHNWVKFIKKSTEKSLRENMVHLDEAGKEYSSPVNGVINHVITHSHYHRGQINLLLRKNGIDPPILDMVYYLMD